MGGEEFTQTSSEVSVKTKTESKFFFIDDFFYWLGCKFVTCDKAKQELEKAQ
jgi:hypothetical protein